MKRESFLNKLAEMCTADVLYVYHKAKFISCFSNVLISLITIPSYIILVLVMDIWGRYFIFYPLLPIFSYKSTEYKLFHDLRKPLLVVMMLIPGAACVGAAFLKVSARFSSSQFVIH
jgi:hypothetical protein